MSSLSWAPPLRAVDEPRRIAPRASAAEPAGGWPMPAPFDAPELPPFPLDALPQPYRAFVAAEAAATQTPPDMAAVFVLAALATVCAGHAVIEPVPGWTEPACAWFAVGMEPGSRKSAVERDVSAPIRSFELELIEQARPIVAEAASRRRMAEQRQAKAERRAVDAVGIEARDLELEARALAVELEELRVPELPRLFTNDATPEAIASLMAANGGVLSVLSAEGGVFDIMAGRYNNGIPNLDVFLKGHSGDAIRIDRRGRPPERIDSPALTMGLAVQPFVLRRVATVAEFTGRGLLDRFLFVLPAGNVGYRAVDAPSLPLGVRAAYEAAVLDLGRAMRSLTDPALLAFDSAGLDVFTAWRAAMEPRRRPDGDMAKLAGWSSKLDGAAARIAGLLHLAEHGPIGTVGADSVTAALSIADYLAAHALAAHDLMRADPILEHARHVARWIRAGGRERFTRRELHRAMPQRFTGHADELDAVLAVLVDADYLRPLPNDAGSAGRRPSPAFVVNPNVLRFVLTIPTESASAGHSVDSVSSPRTNGSVA